jgi:hypothetical protein
MSSIDIGLSFTRIQLDSRPGSIFSAVGGKLGKGIESSKPTKSFLGGSKKWCGNCMVAMREGLVFYRLVIPRIAIEERHGQEARQPYL